MPGKVKVKIIAGKNLPVMDRSSDTTDAYVEIKLGGTTYKTDVCRKSLHPQWNSEWYKFELDDSDLQDEPLQMRLMDHDTYSANDAIGKVYLDLNPLLLPSALMKCGLNSDSNKHDNTNNSVFSGWIPVYDTMHGIRGEVNVIVKVELFSDLNKYRQSSCGVLFFNSPTVPYGYCARSVYGLVEELVVNDDPEYQWIDKIRTPRASNEARQTLFFKLSGELRRKIGVKALEYGANSVIGYRQSFDLEGESGIVARGIGTAAFLVKALAASDTTVEHNECHSSPVQDPFQVDHHRSESVGTKISHSPAKIMGINCRRSSDSDINITPKGNSLPNSDRSGCVGHLMKPTMNFRSVTQQDNLDMLEYPFLTMTKYPSGFISHLGGSVNTRSVKLLERNSNMEEPEKRDAWWSELRMEIRSHARSLNCNAVLGYAETSSICEDVCILSASGTAAIIGIPQGETSDNIIINIAQDGICTDKYENKKMTHKEMHMKSHVETEQETAQRLTLPCTLCHLPYNVSFSSESSNLNCALCRNGKVPEVLLTSIDLPEGVPTIGMGCFLHASVHRSLKELKGESNAKEISDGLPFLEYELHRILVNKMKMKGMNSIFRLKIEISIGERVLLGTATGTAVFLAALHVPNSLKLISDRTVDNRKIAELQVKINDIVKRNKEVYQLKNVEEIQANGRALIENEAEEEISALELSSGNKEFCLLEVDDPDDAELMNLLAEDYPPKGIHVVNTESVTGLEELEIVKNLQMFKQIYRCKIQYPFSLNQHFQKLLQCLYFKMRRMIPCAVCDLQLSVNIPETDEIQITVLGMILGLGDTLRVKFKKKAIGNKCDDLIFNMDGVDIPENSVVSSASPAKNSCVPRDGKQGHVPYKERHGVDISPLSYIPGAKIERYLGNLNFFLIRETTSIREEGGLCAFVHSFATEILAIVRAHITALGGNGMVSYFMNECILNYNIHKNQGQCLINVGGDVVFVSYFLDD